MDWRSWQRSCSATAGSRYNFRLVSAFNTVLTVVGLIVAILFTLVVYVTGKGDAMSGAGGVRTSFKGKASFEDIMSRITLYLGISFMAIMIALDLISNLTK